MEDKEVNGIVRECHICGFRYFIKDDKGNERDKCVYCFKPQKIKEEKVYTEWVTMFG